MHDLLVDGVAGLISFVKEKLGDDGVEEAWAVLARAQLARSRSRRSTRSTARSSPNRSRRPGAPTRPAGSAPNPGAFEIDEDDEKLTFTMNPCGSGQRLWRNRRYGPDGWGVTDEAHDWSYGREGFPLYCTHCAFMNETLPIRWIGHPVYPSRPA